MKLTNGVHDTDPNGTNVVQLVPGDPVTWTYQISNPGNVSFAKANVVVTDNQTGVTPAAELSGGFVVGDTNQNNMLDPGETWTYSATGTAVDLLVNAPGYITVPGLDPDNTGNTQPVYENTGKVTITNTTLVATDLSHYANIPSSPGNLPSTLSGIIFVECDNDGIQQPGETGVAGVTVTLTGFDTNSQVVNMVTTTNSLGQYSFSVTNPGTYVVTAGAASGYIEGKTMAGSAGGTANGNAISSITLVGGTDATGYNFALLHPGSLSGYVYYDLNHNGVMDTPDYGIAHVTVTLDGSNDLGQSIHMVTTTNDHGFYSFDGLRPGTYDIIRTHPVIFVDYQNNAGSLGGTVGKNSISSITMPPCGEGVNYNFGELQSKTCNLRNLAISVGNLFYHFERSYQSSPATIARHYPKLVPYLAAGKVPFGIAAVPQGQACVLLGSRSWHQGHQALSSEGHQTGRRPSAGTHEELGKVAQAIWVRTTGHSLRLSLATHVGVLAHPDWERTAAGVRGMADSWPGPRGRPRWPGRAAGPCRRRRRPGLARPRCRAATPTFSTTQPSSVKMARSGAVTAPPSIRTGKPRMPTRPPQVRLPTSGPRWNLRNIQGSRSPPEPAVSSMIITLGPRIAALGVRIGSPWRVAQ